VQVEAEALFPVGLLSLRLLTIYFLSQAGPLGGLHRASPVPFRASYFTPGLHPPGATAQRLIACLYRLWSFPLMTSLRLVAHLVGKAIGYHLAPALGLEGSAMRHRMAPRRWTLTTAT
jgi:hypothetical protein